MCGAGSGGHSLPANRRFNLMSNLKIFLIVIGILLISFTVFLAAIKLAAIVTAIILVAIGYYVLKFRGRR